MCRPRHHQPDCFTCEFWIWMVPGGSACVNTCPCDVTMATGWYRVPPEGIICRHKYQVPSAATGSYILHHHQSLINFLSAPQIKRCKQETQRLNSRCFNVLQHRRGKKKCVFAAGLISLDQDTVITVCLSASMCSDQRQTH